MGKKPWTWEEKQKRRKGKETMHDTDNVQAAGESRMRLGGVDDYVFRQTKTPRHLAGAFPSFSQIKGG